MNTYLREFEFIFKKALAPKSGAQDGCFNEKTEGRKSRDTVPLYHDGSKQIIDNEKC
jgi:hypothetical protein